MIYNKFSRKALFYLSVVGVLFNISEAHNEDELHANKGLRGINLDKALSGHKEALEKYRSGFLHDRENQPPHPFQHAFEKGIKAAEHGAAVFREHVEKTHERLKAHREEIKARLASYEEGSEGYHFSWDCAKRSVQGADVCVPESETECTWCTVQGMIGFCTSVEDIDTLSDIGITCGGSSDEEEEDLNLVSSEQLEVEKSFSLKCVESTSAESCGQTTDEDNQPCNWCQYNSWIGVCISPDDKENAEDNLFLTCSDTALF